MLKSKVSLVNRLERVPETAGTHSLQSQEWAWSTGLKGARNSSNSHPAEPKVGLVNRLERVSGTAATHSLQSQEWA